MHRRGCPSGGHGAVSRRSRPPASRGSGAPCCDLPNSAREGDWKMSEAVVQVKVEDRAEVGRVATVTVDNRRRLNCLSTPVIVELAAAMTRLAEDRVLRSVVLTGAGEKAFIGGADLNELGALCADSARLF